MDYTYACGHTAEGKYKPSERITKCRACYYKWKSSLTTEQIREMRQERADRKAARLREWAGKREQRATAQLNSYTEIRHDIAFCTQPGRIPFRERMNRADDRAFESLKIAEGMTKRAESLEAGVRVKGDAERDRQHDREKNDGWVKVGMEITCSIWGRGIVKKINKKTYTVNFTETASGNFTITVDKSWIRKIKEDIKI